MTSSLICLGIGLAFCFDPNPPPPPPETTVTVCPVIEGWPAAEQARVASELKRLGAGSASARAVGQLIRLRDQARACESMNARGVREKQ